jgi:hypothetical protein
MGTATEINPLNAQLIPICHLLALLGANHILHISGLRVKTQNARIYVTLICLRENNFAV